MPKKLVCVIDESFIRESISEQLLSKSYCSSPEESACVAEEVCIENNLAKLMGSDSSLGKECVQQDIVEGCVQTLMEYVPDLTPQQAEKLIQKAMNLVIEDDDDRKGDCVGKELSYSDSGMEIEDDMKRPFDDENDEYIGEGECEICERTISLTKHHLIPKATWPRMKKRMINASSAILSEDYEQATKILGMNVLDGLHTSLPNFPPNISSASLTVYLGNHVCKICRPCHSMIHSLHSEMELAEDYNTVEKLLSDERVVKFAKWANKQKPGKHSVRRKK